MPGREISTRYLLASASKVHWFKWLSRLCLSKPQRVDSARKRLLHGTGVAVYIAGQERRLVDPPSQVVAGVRTVTTNMDGRDALPRMSRPFAFVSVSYSV
jgi:hypothetical protein